MLVTESIPFLSKSEREIDEPRKGNDRDYFTIKTSETTNILLVVLPAVPTRLVSLQTVEFDVTTLQEVEVLAPASVISGLEPVVSLFLEIAGGQ